MTAQEPLGNEPASTQGKQGTTLSVMEMEMELVPLDGVELCERLTTIMKVLEPYLLRAVRCDEPNGFLPIIETVANERRARDRIAGFEYGID